MGSPLPFNMFSPFWDKKTTWSLLADLTIVAPRKQTQTYSNIDVVTLSHIFVVLLYPVANTIASNDIFLPH